MRNWIVKVALLATVTAATVTSTASGSNAPVRVTFDKHVADPAAFVFAGTTGGDVTGALTSKLVRLRGPTGPNLHITFDWIVTAADPAKSFTARTTGIWNTKTGSVVMNGTVIEGYLLGAQVHEVGKLLDPATLHFAGSLRLMPGSAG